MPAGYSIGRWPTVYTKGTDTPIKPIDTSAITTNAQALQQLGQLNRQLAGATTGALIPFNLAYEVVTESIRDGLAAGRFSDAALIEHFSVCFANYYFRAINGLLAGSPDLPLAWAKLAEPGPPRPASILLLMGANAHINHDLPLALQDALAGRTPSNLLGDLVKVDRLLVKSTREILRRYDEPNPLVGFVKRHCRLLYFHPVIFMVRHWRIRAWYSYKSLQNPAAHKPYVDRSLKIANRLARLGKRLS